MHLRSPFVHLAALNLLLGLVACGPAPTATLDPTPTQTPPPTQAATPAPTATFTPLISTECQNPLYPVVNGASWQYAGDWSVHGPLSLTRGFAEIGADGFTEQDVWSSGLTRTARMTCDGGNIQAIDLGTVVGTVSSTSIQLVADDVIADGFVLPAGVSPGDTWTQTLDITGKAVISENVSAPAHNEAAISCTAGQSESITVAAGTFDAIRIDCEVKMHVTVAVPAINEVTQDITSVTSAWLAPGVGLVRTQAESDLEDYSYELVSYEIP